MQYKKLTGVRLVLAASVIMSSLTSAAPAWAKDLIVAIRTEPSSLDPHFDALTSNMQVTHTIFEPAIRRDANMAPQPCLAESWESQGNTWTFKLRPDVKFSDGSPLTAEDVVFSYKRVPLVPNAPSPLTIYMQHIVDVQALDTYTVQITTDQPYPLVLNNMAGIPIMPAKIAQGSSLPEGVSTLNLNAGKGLIGTGPYKFVSWKRGAELIFERNPHYWGEKPQWDRIIMRPITNPASRVAALLAGDVDLIEDPPVEDFKRLQENPNVRLTVKGPTYRLIFVGLDTFREQTPGITGANGKNPLQDRRVRQAMSLAIDRQAIVNRVMNGMATPAAQLAAYPMFGTIKELQAPLLDLNRAKELMKEAGYPNGFTLVFGSTNGRYMNDVKVAQTLAMMWARIGIKVSVDALTPSVYFNKAESNQYSAYLMGWGAGSGELSNPMTALVLTVDKAKGWGVTNYGRYSNPEIDALVAKAGVELDNAKREQLLQQAHRMALEDYALIPLQFEHSVWAMHPSIDYKGRMDQMTMVAEIKAVP